MPCSNCGGAYPHETVSDGTRVCGCGTTCVSPDTFYVQADPSVPLEIDLDSLPGGSGWALGEQHAKSTVREWHPRCARPDGSPWCKHLKEAHSKCFGTETYCEITDGLEFENDTLCPKTHGCLAHTDFDKEDESDE